MKSGLANLKQIERLRQMKKLGDAISQMDMAGLLGRKQGLGHFGGFV